ncbi:alpha/beta hydrolase [uncultured Tenacibaculum sp.]|uniref:alpha/beta hydrolase n=1 Tax=uncultured Tenacibaculum sp. TaxID=174713 RepID=UPI0026353A11|nr:alpha/beta fold hydrolase [uncultured Tenacibaculum sp.]
METSQNRILPSSMPIPNKIKKISRFIQFVSPSLVTKFSLKLFSTPIKFPLPNREKTMWESAQKSRLKVSSIDREIDVLTYGYSPKKVLLVHGWCGRSTQLFMVADKLLEKGYMVISFDAPAHGKSEGKTTLMPEFIEAIHEINKEHGPFEAAVGHSLGGMSLYSAYADGFKTNKIVSIGSGDTISEILMNFTNNLTIKPKIAKRMKNYYDKKLGRDIDLNASSETAKQVDIPALVVHDSLDGDVAVSCAYSIRQNLNQGSILITQGLGHTKILRDKETMNRVVDFIIS